MISENTVFILGAGASKPYGYPTAIELRKEIIFNTKNLLKEYAAAKRLGDDFETHPFVKNVMNIVEVFKKSSTSSIDLFLSRNKEFYKIGKQIITLLLGNYEINSKFGEDMQNQNQDWYTHIFEVLTKEIITPTDIEKFKDNKISIITFNYDRSFEHFIFESLLHSFRSKINEIDELMRNLKIIHVYGKLAPLPWELNPMSVGYGKPQIRDHFGDYSENIKIIYDERENITEEVGQLITDARKIFFLGFGYANENLEMIGFNKTILKKEQRIFGTAMGLTQREIIKHISNLQKNNNHMIMEKFRLENCDSLLLLRNYL